jgi:hypothetical protein
MAPKKIGFSQLPHGFHERISELSGSQLKVWLAHRCREGKKGESFPSIERLAQDTGICADAVKDARKWLRENGWLTSSGQKRTGRGLFSIPIEHTTIPDIRSGKTPPPCSGKTPPPSVVVKNGSGKTPPRSRPKKLFEVDPKVFEVDPDELHPTNHPTETGLDDGQVGGKNLSDAEATAAGKEELTLTEDVMREHLQKVHRKTQDYWNSQFGDARYQSVPVTPNLTGCEELFDDLRKRGITRVDQMGLVCDAYKLWFNCKYIPSFDEHYEAEERRNDAGDEEIRTGTLSKSVYVPEPIRCPFVMFRMELAVYLDAAREECDEIESSAKAVNP